MINEAKEMKLKAIMKKILDGYWEAMNDVKPGRHVEIRNTDNGKRFMVYVKEDEDEYVSPYADFNPGPKSWLLRGGGPIEEAKKCDDDEDEEDEDDDEDEDKEGLDPVDKKALKGSFKDREDKDIDNDGDSDSSDKYLHTRRKAVSKAIKKHVKEDVEWLDEAAFSKMKKTAAAMGVNRDLAARKIKKATNGDVFKLVDLKNKKDDHGYQAHLKSLED